MRLQEALRRSPAHVAFQEMNEGDALVLYLPDQELDGIIQPYVLSYPGYYTSMVIPSLQELETILQRAEEIIPDDWHPGTILEVKRILLIND